METGLVSVIIPTYNRAQLVCECVESVLAQEYEPKEIIVIDDGSTDDTAQALAQFSDRINCIRQENQGAAAARQRGLDSARGEFLSFLDSDDLWDERFLALCVAALAESGAGLAFTNYSVTDRHGRILVADQFRTDRPYLEPYREAPSKLWHHPTAAQTRALFLRHLPNWICGTVLRRELVKHPFTAGVTFGEDRLFLTDFVLGSNCAAIFTWECLVTMRIHGGNIFQGNNNVAEVAPQNIRVTEQTIQRHATTLTAAETCILHHRIADDYFDWGYYAARNGGAGEALARYWQSFRHRPSLRTAMAAAKAPIFGLLRTG